MPPDRKVPAEVASPYEEDNYQVVVEWEDADGIETTQEWTIHGGVEFSLFENVTPPPAGNETDDAAERTKREESALKFRIEHGLGAHEATEGEGQDLLKYLRGGDVISRSEV
jgi:hypothetical protein